MEAIMKAIKVLSGMLLVLLLASAFTVVSQEKNSPAKSSYRPLAISRVTSAPFLRIITVQAAHDGFP
jgi:hypothetical protein